MKYTEFELSAFLLKSTSSRLSLESNLFTGMGNDY